MSWVVDKAEEGLKSAFHIVKDAWDATRDFAEFIITLQFDLIVGAHKILFRDILAPLFKPIFGILGIEDETIYSVEVVTTPLLNRDSKYFTNIVINSILNDLDLSDEIRFAVATGQKITTRNFLTYAKNNYVRGVPEVGVSEYFSDHDVVVDTLETLEGETITIDSIAFNIPNDELWCKDYLIDNNSYVMSTNILISVYSNWSFSSVNINGSLDAFVVHLVRTVTTTIDVDNYTQVFLDPTEFTATWTRTTTTVDPGTPSQVTVNTLDTLYNKVATSTGGPYITTFVPVSSTPSEVEENSILGVEVPIYNSGGYYGVVYSLDSAPTVGKIWFYESALETYPALNRSIMAGGVDNVDALPIVTLREQFVNVDSDPTSELYLTTKRLLDILSLVSLDDILTSISDNPDIALIQDSFLVFGVNIYTEDQYSLRYLFNFFMMLSLLPKYDKTAFLALSALDKSNSSFLYMTTQDRFNITLTGNYIEITEISGYIGKIGYVETEFTILPNTLAAVSNITNRYDPAKQDPNDSLGLVNSVFYIRTQLTTSVYSEIEVSGLTSITNIITVGVDVGSKNVALVDPVTGSTTDKNNFIIPVSYNLLRHMTPVECEQIIYDSLNLLVYAEQVTELAYYETEAFFDLVSFVIDAIALIITIITLTTASSLSAALIALGKQVLVQVSLSLILREVLSHNLSDVEKAAALALYAIASYKGAQLISNTSSIIFADQLLLTVNSIVTFFEVDLTNKNNELLKEHNEFTTLATKREEELKSAQEWLTPDGTIDLFNLLNSRVIPVLDTTSTPEEFYAKSLLVNVAPIVLSQPRNYVPSVLDLRNITPVFDIPNNEYIDINLELT